MKTNKKALLTVLCALLLVVASVMGTLAYLTAQDSVTNTFTVGNVTMTMDEADVNEKGEKLDENGDVWVEDGGVELADRVDENDYKLYPGATYVKDPTLHVSGDASYLFVKIDNQIAAVEIAADEAKETADKETIKEQILANGWTELDGEDNVYWKSWKAADGADVVVFEKVNIAANATNEALADVDGDTVVVTAYAIQAEGMTDAADAWTKGGFGA